MSKRFLNLPSTALLFSFAAATAGEPIWIIGNGEVPATAVYAGSENDYNYYVCRGEYMNGLHPGKLHAGKCNIEWNWGEVVLDNYEVLLEEQDWVRWVPDSMGSAPADAFPVGSEDGSTVYSCAAEVPQKDESGTVIGSLGTHAGKLRAGNCNIPYGGGAYLTDRYAVLVVLTPTAVKPGAGKASLGAPAAGRVPAGTYDLNGRSLTWKKAALAGGKVRIAP